jgi:hypothetical protein
VKLTDILGTKKENIEREINELQANIKSRNMKDLYTGINGFKNCCQLMGNLVKEEKGDVLADPHGILYWLMKNHLC